MSASKDEILADFQACTGIDDVGEAIAHLEQCDWDLLIAINNVLPQDTQTLPSERSSVPAPSFRPFTQMEQDHQDLDISRMEEDDMIVIPSESNGSTREGRQTLPSSAYDSSRSNNHAPVPPIFKSKLKASGSSGSSKHQSKVSLSGDFMSSGPSGSKKGQITDRDIKFVVRNGSEVLEINLAECETVDTLKTLVHAQFEIPPCQQKLIGWPNGEVPPDGTGFGALKFPDEVNLVLNPVNSMTNNVVSGSGTVRVDGEEHTLVIRDENKSETHTIKFSPVKTVRGVKESIFSITDVPVRFQVWTGWPPGTADNMTLDACGLDKPLHNLTVKKQASATSSSADLSKKIMDLSDGSETSSDVEDLTESYPLEEDYFVPEVNPTPQKYLIPDNTSDEAIGSIMFADNFYARYGSCHPMFFHGTLEDAVKEACMQPAKNRKQLAIYLHHDGSVMSNVFCQQILCNESVVSYLTNNYVMWGWDVTNESNRQLLLSAANKNFGAPGVGTIRSIERDRYPVIIIVSRVRSATEICSVVYGATAATVDELMGNLMHTSEMYMNQKAADVREEEERDARERVKREQDEAYEQSLIADRAKDEAKRAVEQQKQNEEMKQQQADQQARMLREQIADTLPPEPDSNSTDPICSLKCRLPGGKVVSRRFLQSTTINVLFDYLFTQGFSRDEYRFLTTYPKRDLTNLAEVTAMSGVFSPQDTLIVEER